MSKAEFCQMMYYLDTRKTEEEWRGTDDEEKVLDCHARLLDYAAWLNEETINLEKALS